MNPCACGFYPDRSRCRCTSWEVNRHYGRISRPILDRIDISIALQRVSFDELTGKMDLADKMSDAVAEKNRSHKKVSGKRMCTDSAGMRAMVARVWQIQRQRLGDGRYNSGMTNDEIKKFCTLDVVSEKLVRDAYEIYGLSARAYYKILKVARTLADIDGNEKVEQRHVLEALSYRVKDKGDEE